MQRCGDHRAALQNEKDELEWPICSDWNELQAAAPRPQTETRTMRGVGLDVEAGH
jgi:hypothetical protein